MTEQTDGAQLDAEDFDLDAWIDGTKRPETTVTLYPNDVEYIRRVRDLERRLGQAEKVAPENRGMDDPTPETIAAELDELRAEREAGGLRVRLRQITKAENLKAIAKAKKPGKDISPQQALYVVISKMTVHPSYDGPLDADDVPPHFSPRQLERLYKRDASGEAMFQQLMTAADQLIAGLPTPS